MCGTVLGLSEIDHRFSQITGPILFIISPVSWSLSGGIGTVDHSLLSKTLPIPQLRRYLGLLDPSKDKTVPYLSSLRLEGSFLNAGPLIGVTAWNALTGGRPLQAGDTVLTLGSGGVSLFALQFAQLFGARVIATTSSKEREERLRALGADAVVNYRTTPDWHVAVRELTQDRGVDQVIEVGGPGTLEQSIKSTRFAGEIALIGSLARGGSPNDFLALSVVRAAIAGVVTLRSIAAGSRAHFLAMNRAITQHQLKPVIDQVFPFEDAQAAYRYYEQTHPFGKVVINHG